MVDVLDVESECLLHPEVAGSGFTVEDFFEEEVSCEVEGLGEFLGPLDWFVGLGFADEEVAEDGPGAEC